MEELIGEVASQTFGARWQQFYHRLGLQYRDRYRIEVEHKDKAETDKIQCCVKDTIALWLKSTAIVKLSEREKMKTLLDTLSTVQGFETIALELSGKYGIDLKRAIPARKHILSKTSVQESSGSSPGVSEFLSKTQFTDHQARRGRVECDGATTWTEHEALSTDSSPSQGHRDLESAHLPMSSEAEQFEIESSTCSSYSIPLSTTSERATKQDILQISIDMTNIVHKFAVLDIVQRISLDHWTTFSSLLGLGEETVEILSREKAPEERYYKSIKEWLKVNRERATFAALNELLEQCSEHRAQVVMRKRLECNRDTL